MIRKKSGVFAFAGVKVRIRFNYEYFLRFAAGYRSEGRADFSVSVGKRDIRAERAMAEAGQKDFSDPYFETLAIARKLCRRMAEYGVIFFHAAAVAVDGEGYLFAAPSGTGKSTHARLWREMLGERAVTVNDDKPFIRFVGGTPYVYGSPWNGKHRLDANMSCPIRGICFLEQAAENSIAPLAPREAFPRLCRQIFFSREEKRFGAVMDVAGRLCSSVPLYRMGCNVTPQAAAMSYEAMRRGGEK